MITLSILWKFVLSVLGIAVTTIGVLLFATSSSHGPTRVYLMAPLGIAVILVGLIIAILPFVNSKVEDEFLRRAIEGKEAFDAERAAKQL